MKEKNERTTCEREEYEIVKDTQEAENEMADNKSTFDGPPGSTGAATAEIPLQNTEAFVKNNSSPEKSVTDSSQLPASDEKQPPSGQVYGDSDIYVNGTVIGQFLDTYIFTSIQG